MSTPVALDRPTIRLMFEIDGVTSRDYGHLFSRFEFKGTFNGGYEIRANLFDAGFNLLSSLVEDGYFKVARRRAIIVKFQILAGARGTYPQSATKLQTAILTSLEVTGSTADKSNLEFVAIDPPSWYLNIGDASGSVLTGRLDQVIKRVVNKYAPSVTVDVGRTADSEYNKWYMMRQDPKTFIRSLLDWSAALAIKKTNWLLEMDGFNLNIKEQASFTSRQRAYYRFLAEKNHDTIKSWQLLADNSMSVVDHKLTTAGVSAVSGQSFDQLTGLAATVTDERTSNKLVARITDEQGFSKASATAVPHVGWTHVPSIPEIYSAGDLGMAYQDYLDGTPRGLWLNLLNAAMRIKLEVLGHGEWSECCGLGVDTIFVRWIKARSRDDSNQHWWVSGNWLVYGFHHRVSRGSWMTELHCARWDHNAIGRKIGAGV